MSPRLPLIAALVVSAASAPASQRVTDHRPAPAPTDGPSRSLFVPLEELGVVRATANRQIDRMVRRDPDGGARATYRVDGTTTRVELRGLRVVALHDLGVSGDDKRLGLSHRYRCSLRAQSHRVWLPATRAWSEWRAGSHPAFPRRIEVVCEDGRWRAHARCDGEFVADATGAPLSHRPAAAGEPRGAGTRT